MLTFTAGIVYGFVKTRPELEEPDVHIISRTPAMRPRSARAGSRAGHDADGVSVFAGIEGAIHPSRPIRWPRRRSGRISWPRSWIIALVEGMKIGRRIINNRVLDMYRAFEMNPGDAVQTDDEWLDFARMNGQTTYHVIGTCKIGSEPLAVVDDELRVHGVAGLRVIDASIMPTMVSGNTNAAVIMIAEKAADMIKAAQQSVRVAA